LTAIRFDGCTGGMGSRWICLCDCGNYTRPCLGALTRGMAKSCGVCQPPKTTHGGTHKPEYSIWRAMKRRCTTIADYALRGIVVCERYRSSFGEFYADLGGRPSAKHSLERIDNDRGYSCGKCPDCKKRGEPVNCRWATMNEQANNRRTARPVFRPKGPRHGQSKTVEYTIWGAIKARCKTNKTYVNRGIRCCMGYAESFDGFFTDLGPRPLGHSIDRIDNNYGYSCGKCEDCKARGEPANCKWATKAEQVRNTRTNHFITFEDQTLTLAEWSRKTGVAVTTILYRLQAGWPLNEALLTPGLVKFKTPNQGVLFDT
jgi:hypothetical protein